MMAWALYFGLSLAATDQEEITPSRVAPEVPPVPIFMPTPVYPRDAIRSAIGGLVTACFTVTQRGKVKDVVIIDSSNDLFRKPVLKAARRSTFKPALESMKPVSSQLCRTYRFDLQERSS